MNWNLFIMREEGSYIRFNIYNDKYQTEGNSYNGRITVTSILDVGNSKYISYYALGQNQKSFESYLEKLYPELLL